MFARRFTFFVAALHLIALSEINGQNIGSDSNFYGAGVNWNISNANEWYIDYPTCGGDRQSPIDINSDDVVNVIGVPNLRYVNYDVIPINMTFYNAGTAIMLVPLYRDDEHPYITGGLNEGDYLVSEINFHYGPDNEHGSLHTVEGKHFPLEMQMTHYKREYGDQPTALNHSDGIVMESISVEINETPTPIFAKFVDYVSYIIEPGASYVLEPFSLSDLASEPTDDYYTYPGSADFPPCIEVITSIIRSAPLYATEEQIQKIRSAKFATGENTNNRPTQPLCGRKVLHIQQNPDESP